MAKKTNFELEKQELQDPEELIEMVRDHSIAINDFYVGANEALVPRKAVQDWLDSPNGWKIKE